jgi:dienelactone hydrolase
MKEGDIVAAASSLEARATAAALCVELFESRQERAERLPGLVVIPDALGIAADVRAVAQPVADQGHLVALPNRCA